MKLSIITCTYNSEKYLQETINSIIKQNIDKNIYEHIFIDGFSNDNTINIINNYIIKNPNKNIIIKQSKPKGIYDAMNKGIQTAKGEYITFLNSDDYYNNNVINNYLNFIKKTGNKDLYYGINNIVNSNGKELYEYPNRSIYKKGLKPYILSIACYIFASNTLYKRILHNRYGLYNENYKLVSDAEFFIKLAKAKITNNFYNKVIANFRIHDGSASNNSNLQTKEFEAIKINIFGTIIGNILNLIYFILKKN